MTSQATHQSELPPQLDWPRLEWRAAFWLTFIPFLLSFFVFFSPILPEEYFPQQLRNSFGLILFLSPALLPAISWIWKTVLVALARARYYKLLRQQAEYQIRELQELKKNLFEILERLSNQHAFEITSAGFIQGHLYISIPRKRTSTLRHGDVLAVVHMEDAMLMGMFKVTEERTSEYYAVATSGIDPLWMGYIRQLGQVTMLPHMAAIYLPQGEKT